jgi:hypothetical protein
MLEHLRKKLQALKEDHALAGIKGGTEVEAMSFDEILLMREISRNIVPMTVKIGGPEARNDVAFMLRHGIDVILAPMIESVYALKNFVDTMGALDPKGKCLLAINMETVTAYEKLPAIFSSDYFRRVGKVTVGRSDLSASMNLDVDSREVANMTRHIVALARVYNKTTSVGGQINPENAHAIQRDVKSDYVNTRHMLVSCEKGADIAENVRAALEWEKEFYSLLLNQLPERREFYRTRISSIETRQKVRVPA